MIKAKRFIKYVIAIFILMMLYICIWGVPLMEARITVRDAMADVSGTFTGIWSPIKGKEGTFISEEGWIFEGEINPDGGLWKGELRDYPGYKLGKDEKLSEETDLYTVTIEDGIVIDERPE